MEEGQGPRLPIGADVPWRMIGLGGQTGAPLSLCRYRQLLYITGEKTTHFISPPLLLSLSAPSIIHCFSSSLTGAVAFSQFLQHRRTQADTHAVYLSKTPLPALNPPPQRNSFQLCGLLKKPLYAELT